MPLDLLSNYSAEFLHMTKQHQNIVLQWLIEIGGNRPSYRHPYVNLNTSSEQCLY